MELASNSSLPGQTSDQIFDKLSQKSGQGYPGKAIHSSGRETGYMHS